MQDVEEVAELEEEVSSLKSQLTEEQDKNVRLVDRLHKLRNKLGINVSWYPGVGQKDPCLTLITCL